MGRYGDHSLGKTLGTVLALLVVGTLTRVPATAQPDDDQTSRSGQLMHDIQILEMLRSANFTADERSQAAAVIQQFDERRQAAEKMRDSEALIQALTAVRAALVHGKPPTPPMRQAVQAAQPPDQEAIRRATDEAYGKALDGLTALLTEDQKTQIEMMPIVAAAQDLVGWSLDAQPMPAEEWQKARLQAFGELRDRIRHYAGAASDAALSNLQHTIDRFHEMPADQLSQQRSTLVTDLVTTLKDALMATPQAENEQLRDQLVQWLEDPRMSLVLKESATAMGG